jgi:citrate lyase alpha subunit
MALSAERLPVGLVPEEIRIAFVGNDVINNGGNFRDSFSMALTT